MPVRARFFARQAGTSNQSRLHEWVFNGIETRAVCCRLSLTDPYARPNQRRVKKATMRICNGAQQHGANKRKAMSLQATGASGTTDNG